MTKCKKPGCDKGWLHHQHPLKPPGVIMHSTPCPECNLGGHKPHPATAGTLAIKRISSSDDQHVVTVINSGPLRVGPAQPNEPQLRTFISGEGTNETITHVPPKRVRKVATLVETRTVYTIKCGVCGHQWEETGARTDDLSGFDVRDSDEVECPECETFLRWEDSE